MDTQAEIGKVALSWFSTDFGNKKVAKSLQCTLERCGLKIAKIEL